MDKFRENQWITIKATGEQGQIWSVNDKCAFVCVPDNNSPKTSIYTLDELSP